MTAFRDALKAAAALRNRGIRTRVEVTGRKLRKSLASASSKGIRFVVLIGETEAAAEKLRVKDMAEMTESLVGIEEAIELIQRAT